MDNGWAVVLGAVIAFFGSALLPWVRDAWADRRRRSDEAAIRRRDAIVELLAANNAVGLGIAGKQSDSVFPAFERRARAAARLLLELADGERAPIRNLLTDSVPVGDDDRPGGVGRRMNALQQVLTDWAAGSLSVDKIESTYSRLVNEQLSAAQASEK
ncbi:hypothetical protein QWJ90_01435 [Microbacterium oryzae]|uniref:hypothetical protein n=1 Tax=Microbacterium oryzae TaxID=743009 RepID=UPI0025AF8715|nr:hypothetical protein [Microbacterium oryzae]MDN3309585.1 hypothetical protein [Microbacterium oryzae]